MLSKLDEFFVLDFDFGKYKLKVFYFLLNCQNCDFESLQGSASGLQDHGRTFAKLILGIFSFGSL